MDKPRKALTTASHLAWYEVVGLWVGAGAVFGFGLLSAQWAQAQIPNADVAVTTPLLRHQSPVTPTDMQRAMNQVVTGLNVLADHEHANGLSLLFANQAQNVDYQALVKQVHSVGPGQTWRMHVLTIRPITSHYRQWRITCQVIRQDGLNNTTQRQVMAYEVHFQADGKIMRWTPVN